MPSATPRPKPPAKDPAPDKREHISTSQAGYYEFVNGAAAPADYESVQAAWVQPGVTCESDHQVTMVWVGIDDNEQHLEQAGTVADCRSGSAKYYFFTEMYPAVAMPLDLDLSPGDKVSASVTFSGDDTFSLRVDNLTKSTTQTVVEHADVGRVRAQWIVEAPPPFSLAPFGSVTFTGAQAMDDAGRTGGALTKGWITVRTDLAINGHVFASTTPASKAGDTVKVTYKAK
jgi:hypothetical protein